MASAASVRHPGLALRHSLWVLLGCLACAGVARMSYRRWLDVGWALYGVTLILLGWVLVGGASRLGATRWLSLGGFSLQPSEPAKLAVVLMLSRMMGDASRLPLPVRVAVGSLLCAGLPAGLTFLQPDLGSASIFGAIWCGMAWAGGLSRVFAGSLLGGGLALLPVGWWLLRDYQRARLLAFLNPDDDPLGTGYTIIQSTIAMGSGGLWGRGWGQGPQTQLRFLPERHSDFIFAVIGEEWGLMGGLVGLGCGGGGGGRGPRGALLASTRQGRLLAVGITSWVGYQALVNMGMVTGVLPVVGVPLPLVSYGGSAMLSLWVAVGLLQSVARDQHH
jgi:rod shape determining protein RodA